MLRVEAWCMDDRVCLAAPSGVRRPAPPAPPRAAPPARSDDPRRVLGLAPRAAREAVLGGRVARSRDARARFRRGAGGVPLGGGVGEVARGQVEVSGVSCCRPATEGDGEEQQGEPGGEGDDEQKHDDQKHGDQKHRGRCDELTTWFFDPRGDCPC